MLAGRSRRYGFYNIMLDMSPLGATTWWEASCDFGDVARQQSETTFATVAENYRFYFGTGSRHTMWGADKVYTDTTGGVPTVVDWVNAMLASGPDGRDAAWPLSPSGARETPNFAVLNVMSPGARTGKGV